MGIAEKGTICRPSANPQELIELLSVLLWWPRRSGGLGAKHFAIALHDEDSRLTPCLPPSLYCANPLEMYVHSALQAKPPRSNRYDSHLRALWSPVIQDKFGTTDVLDGRYAALQS